MAMLADKRTSAATSSVKRPDVYPRISIVVPVLNEQENVARILPRIPYWAHEVILVDGHSVDETVAVARLVLPRIIVVAQDGHGKGDAMRLGFSIATGDIIVMLDGDGSADPAEIPFFVGALMAGADLAKGTRFAQGGGSADISLVRIVGNWMFTRAVRVLFRNRCTDLCYGYNAIWRDILSIVRLDAPGFEIETQLNLRALRAHLRVVEVPSFEARRMFGESHLSTWSDGWRVARTLLAERLRKVDFEPALQPPRQLIGPRW